MIVVTNWQRFYKMAFADDSREAIDSNSSIVGNTPATVYHFRLCHVAQMFDSFSINCDESFVDSKGKYVWGKMCARVVKDFI